MHLTRLEMDVMELVWKLHQPSVREIHEAIPEKERPAYTTIQTIVQRLEQKNALRRVRKVGNALLFEPTITRQSVYRRLIDDLVDLLGGSEPVMSHLVDSGRVTLRDLKALEARLATDERKPRRKS